jgi:hypothetical protein
VTRYIWRDGDFYNRETGERMETTGRVAMPYIASDIAAYKSVVSNKMIDGRSARREDLKRSGCREVDPSEFKIETARTEKWAKKLGVPHVPDNGPERLPTTVGPEL